MIGDPGPRVQRRRMVTSQVHAAIPAPYLPQHLSHRPAHLSHAQPSRFLRPHHHHILSHLSASLPSLHASCR